LVGDVVDKLVDSLARRLSLGFFIHSNKKCSHTRIVEATNNRFETKKKEEIYTRFGSVGRFGDFRLDNIVVRIETEDLPEEPDISHGLGNFRSRLSKKGY
jgi:hypothetical protein